MEVIEVLTWFNQLGEVRPIKFIRNGESHPIGSTGRRWDDDEGWHVLVMDHSSRVFELVFKPGEKRWYLNKTELLDNKVLPS